MTERTFRFILGVMLLATLYFDIWAAMAALIVVMSFEGITNWRIPSLVSHVRFGGKKAPEGNVDSEAVCRSRIPFDAERAVRVVIVLLLIVSYVLFYNQLWFIPWFVGFALMVAGLSGICPLLIILKRVGFR